MNWLYYLLEANVYLGLFYGCYCVFLSKETHYMLNRAYLLFSCVVSFLLPVIQVGVLKPAVPEMVNTVFIAPVNTPANSLPIKITPVETHFDIKGAVLYLYLLGVVFSLLLFIVKLYQVMKLVRAGNKVMEGGYNVIYIKGSDTAFSFFNYLFLGTETQDKNIVIKHELVHIRQKHSLDIVLLELFKVFNWFSPIVYLLQTSLKNIHEYMADERTAALGTDAFTYSEFLVNNAYGISGPAVAHSFFNYNLLKKRIIMLHQKRSGSLARLKYLIALPVCAGSICASTLGFSKSYGWVDLIPKSSMVNTLNTDSGKISKDEVPVTGIKKVPIMRFPPPAPTFVKNEYIGLRNYIGKTFVYPENAKKARLSGMVILSFELGDDKKISNVIVKQSAGHGFDDAAVHVLTSYQSPINDKTGVHTIGIGFFAFNTSPKQVELNSKTMNSPGFVGDMLIVDQIPDSLKSNGSKTSTEGTGEIKKPADSPSQNTGTGKISEAGPSDVQQKNNYADTIPLLSKEAAANFSKYLGKYIRFPKIALDSSYAGRLIANFSVDGENKITNVTIRRSPAQCFNGEVERVLEIYNGTDLKPNTNYSALIDFVIIDKNGNYIGGSSKEVLTYKPVKDAPGTKWLSLSEVVIAAYK